MRPFVSGILAAAIAVLLVVSVYTQASPEFLRHDADRAPDDQLADQRRQPVQPALLAAQDHHPRQRRAVERRVARAAQRLRHCAAVLRLRGADRP